MISDEHPGYKWVRASFAISSGSFTAEVIVAGRERW
jgi:hypothetical protein